MMVATVTPISGVDVIVVPDDNAEARNVPLGILDMLTQENILMSNDNHRMYVRHTHWENMKASYLLTNPTARVHE